MKDILSFFHTKLGLAVWLFVAVLGGYLPWAHSGHTLASLPYLLLIACPLMHLIGRGYYRHSEAEK